jgi:hypothetical protein
MWRYVLLLLSILAMSTSVIWIKAGTTHSFIVASLRLLLACEVPTPLFYGASILGVAAIVVVVLNTPPQPLAR